MKILLFSASTRAASLNRRLIQRAYEIAVRLEHEASLIDLNDFEMPFYNGDRESEDGLPDAAEALKTLIAGTDALVISTPEYNGSFPALLKNTLDWCSRAGDGLDGRAVFEGKKVIVMAASPGPRGGARVLPAISRQMEILRTIVVGQLGIGEASKNLDSDETAIKIEAALALLNDAT
jgi:NAD(P)H-dependent FMN reductase